MASGSPSSFLFPNDLQLATEPQLQQIACTGVSPLAMFVVTGLHTKRRPHIGTDKSGEPFTRQCTERLSLPPAVSHSHRHSHTLTVSVLVSSSGQAVPRALEPRMDQDSDRDAWSRNDEGSRQLIKVPVWRASPTRVRRFIPKPLILVERMKARQLLLEESSPIASESCVTPWSLNRPMIAMTTPLSTRATPTTRRIPTRSVLSSDSHHSSSASFTMPLQDDVFGGSFGMMPRLLRPLSVVTLGDSPSTTDTFVADSPCCARRASFKVPLLITEANATDLHLDAGSDHGKKFISHISIPLLVDSLAANESAGAFEPAVTSTPFTLNRADTHGTSPSMVFYPTCLQEQIPELPDSSEIVSPTSQAVYPFNAPEGGFTVKLPSTSPGISLSNRTGLASPSSIAVSYSRVTKSNAPPPTHANAPKLTLDLRRSSGRAASPTLVLDGVFALSRSYASSSSPLRVLKGFPRPRKPTSRRPPCNISDGLPIASPPQPPSASPTLTRVQSGPESPRSRLAHVLNAHTRPQTMAEARKPPRVPPLVKGVHVSNDPRTQYEIEGLRARRVVGLGRGNGSDVGGSGGVCAIQRISLAGVGMVAKLRARWETGGMESGGSVDGCA